MGLLNYIQGSLESYCICKWRMKACRIIINNCLIIIIECLSCQLFQFVDTGTPVYNDMTSYLLRTCTRNRSFNRNFLPFGINIFQVSEMCVLVNNNRGLIVIIIIRSWLVPIYIFLVTSSNYIFIQTRVSPGYSWNVLCLFVVSRRVPFCPFLRLLYWLPFSDLRPLVTSLLSSVLTHRSHVITRSQDIYFDYLTNWYSRYLRL